MANEVVGFIGAAIASLFFGSNYIPTKNYPTGDGISFVWFFSAGVLIVGYMSVFIVGETIFIYTGLIGGSLWATGNLCVVPIVKTIGLGLGLLIWGSTSLLTGFFVGKFGWFGVNKQIVPHDALNWVAIVFVILAMAVFFFIKPTVEKRREEYEPLNDKKGTIQEEEEESIWDRIPTGSRKLLGISLAVVSGMLYGVNMVPMTLWSQDMDPKPNPLAFVFSHFTGIYIYSTGLFIIYCIFHRPPKVYAAAILPSMISGAMWGIAQCGLMSATQILGYAVGFPIGSAGPLLVSSTWSVFFFREIRGARNLGLLGLSFLLLLTGIALLTLSNMNY